MGISIYVAQTLGGNVGTLTLSRQEEIGSKLCFRSIDEKVRKRLRAKIRKSVNPLVIFFWA